MSDNIRPILYQAKYDAYISNRASYIGRIEKGDIKRNTSAAGTVGGATTSGGGKTGSSTISMAGSMPDSIPGVAADNLVSAADSKTKSSQGPGSDSGLIKYSIVGKHCESGDVIIEDIEMPEVKTGDLILVGATGAYCYSMSSNYNGQPRSAVVAVEDGRHCCWVERQTFEDLVSKDKKLKEC
jgi:hypothetical protein